MVSADRLRFDFAQPTALSAEDIAAIEAEVNAEIRANAPVTTRLMTPDDAIAAGAMALSSVSVISNALRLRMVRL